MAITIIAVMLLFTYRYAESMLQWRGPWISLLATIASGEAVVKAPMNTWVNQWMKAVSLSANKLADWHFYWLTKLRSLDLSEFCIGTSKCLPATSAKNRSHRFLCGLLLFLGHIICCCFFSFIFYFYFFTFIFYLVSLGLFKDPKMLCL